MTGDRQWRVRLTADAEGDIRDILRWTAAHFGDAQARIYARTLSRAIESLTAGPHIAGARERNEIRPGLMALHVARRGRKGRHIVFYRAGESAERPTVEVLRVLHDSMDIPRRFAGGRGDPRPGGSGGGTA